MLKVSDAEKAAEEYFKLTKDEIPTVTGLALAMGFKSRNDFLNFEGSVRLKKAASGALLRLESILESRLYNKETYNGAKTVLQSCFGWNEAADDAKNKTISEVKRLLEGVGD